MTRRELLRPGGDDAIEALLADDALLAAMVETEIAVTRASARAGVVPASAADAIAAALPAVRLDSAALAARSRAGGNPVIPLLADLRRALPEPASSWLHFGCTSQDVLDTALMLTAHRATAIVLEQARTAFEAARRLAREHRDTVLAGRTLGRQALPTTFGLKAAYWAAGLHATAARLRDVHDRRLAVQLGGAAGTLAAFGDRGPAVLAGLADELGLADPALPWHTERSRVHELGAALGALAAACGKAGTDVVWLAQNEIGEVAEGGDAEHGESSTLPQKRNPVDAVLVRSAALRAPALVATLLTSGLQEHERAAGGWHAEWAPLRDLLGLAGEAAGGAATMLTGLEVDTARMRANVTAAGPALQAEPLVTLLAATMPRRAARDLVVAGLAATGDAEALVRWLRAHGATTEADQLTAALDPAGYLGAAPALVDRVVRLCWEDPE